MRQRYGRRPFFEGPSLSTRLFEKGFLVKCLVNGERTLSVYSRYLMKAPILWEFSATNEWTRLIEYAKKHTRRKTPFRLRVSVWYRPKTLVRENKYPRREIGKEIACV